MELLRYLAKTFYSKFLLLKFISTDNKILNIQYDFHTFIKLHTFKSAHLEKHVNAMILFPYVRINFCPSVLWQLFLKMRVPYINLPFIVYYASLKLISSTKSDKEFVRGFLL